MIEPCATIRASVEAQLGRAHQVIPARREPKARLEGLYMAIEEHRKDGTPLTTTDARMPSALERIGGILLQLLTEADQECSDDDVREIRDLIRESLHPPGL
jgi:hypothetical protein